jgi:hypothetical protein
MDAVVKARITEAEYLVRDQAGPAYVALATRTEKAFRAGSAKLGIELSEWDYSTLEE